MSQPFVGEIRMFGGSFAPAGWAFCSGQLLPIAENDMLFTLIGTTYGGDGQTTFALPDLQSRVPMHAGTGAGLQTYTLGQTGGVESVTLTTNQIPGHTHPMMASGDPASTANVSGNVIATPASATPFSINNANLPLNAASITPVGGSQPHENIQPYLCVSFILSLFGTFPSQT
jgi:microcystin-dependent protein